MNIREAILKAADHIEITPQEFDFGTVEVPDCGSPGCAVGWIEHFLGRERGKLIDARCITGPMECPIGLTERVFYARMEDAYGSNEWRNTAPECARALRLYADKYHPAAPVAFTDWQAMSATRTVSEHATDEMVAR